MKQDLLNNPKLAPARDAFIESAFFSRSWDNLVDAAIKQYGERNGTYISGIYSDHFPVEVQNTLRNMARQVGKSLDLGWKLKPSRVHDFTMRKLHAAVRAKFGGGYYG